MKSDMRNSSFYKKKAGIILLACLFFLSGCLPEAGIAISKNSSGGYVLLIKGKPFLIKGVTYSPTPIGKGYNYSLYSDPNKPWLIDGPLMKKMRINVIRIYPKNVNLLALKEFIHQMYSKFGIYTIVGDWLGLWSKNPNYAKSSFREKVKHHVMEVVKELKDEPGVLMWVLGNENNYSFSGNLVFWTSPEIEKINNPADRVVRRAEIYYKFVDELAGSIKKIDKKHPVALGNGDETSLDIAGRICKNIDVLSLIVYRGKSFGNFFNNVRRIFDKPILISEFGADSYNAYTNKEDQNMQTIFLTAQWKDLYKNTVFSGNKKGNSLGGIIFEWSDEWWKHNEGFSPDWSVHNKEAGWSNGSYYFDIKAPNNLNMNEEWFGLVALSKEKENGINKRIPKKSFYAMKKLWAKDKGIR